MHGFRGSPLRSTQMAPAPISYVRHSMAEPDESRPPTDWQLGDDGRTAARRLAERLEVAPEIGALVTSTEPKAVATAEVIGERWAADVHEDDRLREAARRWIGPGYRAVAHRYLRGEEIDGWEHHDDVAARAEAAVDDAAAIAGGKPVVVVSHGLVLAVHLGRRLGQGFDAESFWSCLAFPDAWALDERGLLHRPLTPAAR